MVQVKGQQPVQRVSFFEDLEELNNSDSEECLGYVNWAEPSPNLARVDGDILLFDQPDIVNKFEEDDIIVVTCDLKDKAIAGNKITALVKVTDKKNNTLTVSRVLSEFPKKVNIYALIWWAVPYPDDLVELQSRQLAKLEEREQSLALKLSSPEVSREASKISKKIQTGELSKEDAQSRLGELALSSGNISPESLSDFNTQTYSIKIQKAEVYIGMPQGHLSILDSLKGLPKQRFLKEFEEIINPTPEQPEEDEENKKKELETVV